MSQNERDHGHLHAQKGMLDYNTRSVISKKEVSMKTHRTLAVVWVVALALALTFTVACTAPASPPTPTSDGAKYGGTLRTILQSVVAGFDVHRKPAWAPVLGIPVFNNLVEFDTQKAEITPQNIVPGLAERWEASSDGKTWTFFLFKGVKWHDDKPFTADDIVYNLEKMVDPNRSANAAAFSTFDRAQKVDDYTVKVYLKAPAPDFLVQLAGPYASILPPQKATIDWKTTDYLVGTGPFKFKSAVSGVSYELVRNASYFKKDASGNQLPYLDGFQYFIVAERAAQTDAVITQRADMTQPTIGIANIEQLQRFQQQAKQIVLQYEERQNPVVFWFNVKSGPLKDVRVRRALAMLMDRTQLTLAAFGDLEFGNAKTAIFSAFYGLTTEEINKTVGWDKPYEQRVTIAQGLLKEAGYASGFKLRMLCPNVLEFTRKQQVIADAYRRYLNIDSQIDAVDFATLATRRDKGDFDLIQIELPAWIGEPNEVVGYVQTGSTANFLGYSNPEVDKLIAQESQEMDLAKRRQLVQSLERILLSDLPLMPTQFLRSPVGTWPYVKGFVAQTAAYGSRMSFDRVWLDTKDPHWATRPK